MKKKIIKYLFIFKLLQIIFIGIIHLLFFEKYEKASTKK